MIIWLRQVRALAALAVLELYRRKDLVVVLILSLLILCPLAFFTPFGVKGASRYVNELTMLLIWVFSAVIALGVSSRLFPPEFESRTIFPLLAKPVDRGTLLAGKYLGACAASLSALVIFYLAYGLLTGVRQGLWFPVVFLQALLLHAGFVVVVSALGLLGSLALTPAANLTICSLVVAGMLVYGQRLPGLVAVQAPPANVVLGFIHWIGPHVEFFDLRRRVVHEWPPIPWRVCLAVTAYAAAYAIVCLLAARGLFIRKKI